MDWPALRTQLRIARETAAMSQAELGRRIGANKSTVGRIEDVAGRPKHAPDLDTIQQWAHVCGLSLSDFFRQLETGHASSTAIRHPGGQVSGDADPVPEKTTPETIILSSEVIAESLKEIAKAIRAAAKPRRSAARTGTTTPKPPKASRKVG